MAEPAEDFGVELGSFDARYMGSIPVKAPTGNDVCTDAVLRLRQQEIEEKKVRLVVTPKGMYIVDQKGEIITATPIKDVSFIAMNPSDKKVFSFIANQRHLNIMLCHTFRVKSKVEEIPLAVNKAFMISSGQEASPSGVKLFSRTKSVSSSQLQKENKERVAMVAKKALGVYFAKYLGSVPVKVPKGNEVVLDALDRIKTLRQSPKPVEILVTETAIEVVDEKTKETIKTVPIMEVTFTALHPKDKKLFSYITNDSRLGLIYCHAFEVKKDKSKEIAEVIGDAFKKATEVVASGDEVKLKELGGVPAPAGQGPSGALGVFEGKYLGTVPCSALKGNEVVDQAVSDLRGFDFVPESVVIMITSEGVKTVEGLTGEVLKNIFISDISFCTTAGPRKEIFAFISKDTRLKRKLCHMFECGAKAMDLTVAIGKAFERAFEEQKSRAGNPFTPQPGPRENVEGELFRFQIHRQDLISDQILGAGQFGQVYLATYKGVKCAVKTVRAGATAEDKVEFFAEAETMVDLQHDCLVRLLGVAVQQRPWLVVIEFMKYGDLRDVTQACKEKGIRLTYLEQLVFLRQIAEGLKFMATNRWIHMDLAARNCLLGEMNTAKVADFGLTRKLDKGCDTYTLKKSLKLPIRWISPEGLLDKIFSEKSDVWAFGVLMWEIMSYGALPYGQVKNVEIQGKVLGGMRLTVPTDPCPQELFDLMQTCFLRAQDRPTFATIAEKLGGFLEVAKTKCPSERDVGLLISQSKD